MVDIGRAELAPQLTPGLLLDPAEVVEAAGEPLGGGPEASALGELARTSSLLLLRLRLRLVHRPLPENYVDIKGR